MEREYDGGTEISRMFGTCGSGVKTNNDGVTVCKRRDEFLSKLRDLCNLPEYALREKHELRDTRWWKLSKAIEDVKKNESQLDNFIKPIHYRPFDIRWTYYSGENKFILFPRYSTMRHMLLGNVGLVFSRRSNLDSGYAFVSNYIIDQRTFTGAGTEGIKYLSPLYLYPDHGVIGSDRVIENLSPAFRSYIDTKYGSISSKPRYSVEVVDSSIPVYYADGTLIDRSRDTRLSPETILGYIYALLYHRDYRSRYLEFLKLDFPKIPFVKDIDMFLELSSLGSELIDLHLMRECALDRVRSFPSYRNDISNKSNVVSPKFRYDESTCTLYINPNLSFRDISPNIWNYYIGGYQVLDKYLKSYKNEDIDIFHYENIIRVIYRSLELERDIASIDIFR